MKKAEILQKIIELKKKKKAIILAHNYQRGEIQDIADYIGDSFFLAQKASQLDSKVIVFCGVSFMAESAKILSPNKLVLLPRKEARCPMADMVETEELLEMKKKYKNAKVVCYINTNAEIKALSDVCCTSRNAVKVIENLDCEKIIFLPDRNLARYVQKMVNSKKIIPWNGFCYVHEKIDAKEVKLAKELHKDSIIIVHPECKESVIELADYVMGTGGMVSFAKKTDKKIIIIGTEEGLIYRLKKENPDKKFFTPGKAQMCRNMKITTLEDVYLALKEEKYKIEVPKDIMKRAKNSLIKMLEWR
jgi:quinolinate synthase